jgi:MFS family permease
MYKKGAFMNRYEKIAWFNLAVFAISVVLYIILFLFLRTKYDFFLSAQVATSAFALIALCAFGPLMFNKTGVIIDEEGTIIRQKHRLYKYLLLWGVYVSIFIGLWIWMKIAGTLSDQVAVLIVFLYVSIFALFAFILYLYFKRQKESGLVADEQHIYDVILYGPDMDERDLMIQKTARWSGFGIFWLFYVFGFMGTWGWARYLGYRTISIEVSILPLFVFGAFILIFTVDTITRVILYRRGK